MKNKILNYINKWKEQLINIVPVTYKNRYISILILWMILLIEGYVTENRLITFSIVLLIISIYKIFHKNINIIINFIDKYVQIKQETLLKIYKYKNPLIWLLIEIELKWFNIMYNITKSNTKHLYKNIICNILYNFTGLNGIKIVLYKFYKILNDWKNLTIYEIIFKRMYGMILSILIFTNIIQILITLLTKISTNWILWIYIFLLIISYIIDTSNLATIEYLRKESNIIWLILENNKKFEIKNTEIINQNIKICIGMIWIKDFLNYENYFLYLLLKTNIKKWIYCKPLYVYFEDEINRYFDTNDIFTKNKLKNQEKNQEDIDLLNYCEYNILLYKLRIFYIWDIEKTLKIKENLITIEKEHDWDEIQFSYEYDIKKFSIIYDEKIKDVKLNKFWDLIENKKFYEKMHTYLYDYTFKNTKVYQKLLELERVYHLYDRYIENAKLDNDEQKQKELDQQLKEFRKEWEKANTENMYMEEKYYNIFKEIDIIKNKYIT